MRRKLGGREGALSVNCDVAMEVKVVLLVEKQEKTLRERMTEARWMEGTGEVG